MFLAAALTDQIYRHDTFVERPDMMIISVLAGTGEKFGKAYCYPSQDKICAMLARNGRHMSRRALNRHTNALVRDGWLKRRRRHTHDPAHGWTFRSTMYTLTRRALRWLAGAVAAGQRAFAFLYPSRVPTSSQYSLHKRIIPEAPPQSGGAPPGFSSKVAADEPGGTENNKKEVGLTHLSKIREILHA